MKIYLEWLEIPCIGIYSGLFGRNLGFWELDAREVFPLSTGFWLARLGSKHKSCMKQTYIHINKDGGSSLWTVEGLAWCSRFCSSSMQVGAATQVNFRLQSLTFQDENPRSGLNWLCLAMSLLKALF
jgi:hypothetical protein